MEQMHILFIDPQDSFIRQYAEALSAIHIVTIVAPDIKSSSTVRGVQLQPGDSFPSGTEVEVVIYCNSSKESIDKYHVKSAISIMLILDMNFNAEERLYDIDLFAFVSEWQQRQYIDLYHIPVQKTIVLLHGVSTVHQVHLDITQKKPIFVCNSDTPYSYEILASTWPSIVESYPTAELHLYTTHTQCKELKNVTIFEPLEQDADIEVYRNSMFYIYFSNECIVHVPKLLEASASGAIPIINNVGILDTYFNTALETQDLSNLFIAKAKEYMNFYTTTPNELFARSERLIHYMLSTRNYGTLANQFHSSIVNKLKQKQQNIVLFNQAKTYFLESNYSKCITELQQMVPFFETSKNVFSYFLWQGVCYYHLTSYHQAFHQFKKASTYDETLQLCINMILTSEKLDKKDDVLVWCEKALKYNFNMNIIHKVLLIVQKKPYFERCKWAKYLLSLWNDDIQNLDWMNLFLSYGNLISGDLLLTLKHEDSNNMFMSIIEKGLAYIELYKLDIRNSIQMRFNLERIFCNLFLNLNYSITNNKEFYKYIDYYMKHLPALAEVVRPTFSKITTTRPIRVGFLSGDLVYHPVSYILNGIVEHMNPTKFETHIFSTTEKKDNSLQNKIRKEATKYHELFGKKIIEVKDSIVAEDIDVLIEMTGHTANGSDIMNVLRWRPARVVANYFAYPNSYGIPEMDYKIGDSVVFPVGLEKYYVEGFCKIKGGLHTYKPIMELSVNHKPHEGIVFGCTNNPKKYRPNWIKSVSKILKGVEGSKLKMRYFNLDDPSIQEFYWKEFEKHGITRDRVDLGLGETLNKYFESYADMDICLDPYPYNGGTINIEILYASLPYITLLGNSYVSRVGASILHQVGHPELIAKTEEQYVQMTIDLAKDTERIKTYKQTLRADMMKSTLGDNKAFAREFEKGVEWMLKEKGWL